MPQVHGSLLDGPSSCRPQRACSQHLEGRSPLRTIHGLVLHQPEMLGARESVVALGAEPRCSRRRTLSTASPSVRLRSHAYYYLHGHRLHGIHHSALLCRDAARGRPRGLCTDDRQRRDHCRRSGGRRVTNQGMSAMQLRSIFNYSAVIILVSFLKSCGSESSLTENYYNGDGWCLSVSRRDAWGSSDHEVRLHGVMTGEMDVVTLIPWGAAFIEKAAWIDSRTIEISGLSRRSDATPYMRVQAWRDIAIRYKIR